MYIVDIIFSFLSLLALSIATNQVYLIVKNKIRYLNAYSTKEQLMSL